MTAVERGEMTARERLRQMLMEDAKVPANAGARTALMLLDNIELTEKAQKKLVDQLLQAHPSSPSDCQSIPMLLTCPGVRYIHGVLTTCGARHIDEGEFATRLHKTHTCQECGFQWQPALVPTVGVKFLPGCENESPEIEFICSVCNAGLPSTGTDSCRPCLMHPQAPPKRWTKPLPAPTLPALVHKAVVRFINGAHVPVPFCNARDNGTPLMSFERSVTCRDCIKGAT